MTDKHIHAPNVLLLGATGSGKTHACGTLLGKYIDGTWVRDSDEDAPVKQVLHVFTEPSMETLADLSCEDGYHYSYVPCANPSWDEMEQSARSINTLSLKALAQREGLNKQEYGQLINLYKTFHNFTCARCGKEFGDVSELDASSALIVDSLSGINTMAMDLVTGSKPIKSMSEWGMAMDRITRLINKLCADTHCWMVLIGHLEIERDEVTGRMKAMVSTLGRKVAPILPRYFSEVIECKKEGTSFFWSTENADVETKTRNLKMSGKLNPDFHALARSWRNKIED